MRVRHKRVEVAYLIGLLLEGIQYPINELLFKTGVNISSSKVAHYLHTQRERDRVKSVHITRYSERLGAKRSPQKQQIGGPKVM